MALLLHIETATPVCSVAISKGGKLLAHKTSAPTTDHATLLPLYIQEVLLENYILPNQIKAISVSIGPGSYTGLRIGLSVAKGLCFTLKIPIISINTLYSLYIGMLQQIDLPNALYCPMIDARRMEVYTAIYNYDSESVLLTQPLILDSTSFAEYLKNQTMVFAGTGAEKCSKILSNANTQYLLNLFPEGIFQVSTAYRKYKNKEFDDTSYLEPLYLKQFGEH